LKELLEIIGEEPIEQPKNIHHIGLMMKTDETYQLRVDDSLYNGNIYEDFIQENQSFPSQTCSINFCAFSFFKKLS
jgi:hypothetical protein